MGKHVLIFIGLILSISHSTAQDRSSIISEMRTKVQEVKKLEQEVVNNNNRISQLERDLARWRIEKEQKLQDARNRLEAKLQEIETSESWKNRRETANKGYKEYSPGTCGAGGPPPICVANHWYYVGSSEAMRDYEAYKESVLGPLRDNIANTDRDYNNRIASAEKEISDLKNRNWGIDQMDLPDARRLAGNVPYDWLAQVKEDDKKKEEEWQQQVNKEELYRRILEDNLARIKEEKHKANSDYLDAYGRMHDQLRDQHYGALEKLRDAIHQEELAKIDHDYASRRQADQLKDQLSGYQNDLSQLEKDFARREMPTEIEKQNYETQRGQLQQAISNGQQAVIDQQAQAEATRRERQSRIDQYNGQISQRESHYPDQVAAIEQNLKNAFAAKEEILGQMQGQAEQDLKGHLTQIRNNDMVRQAERDSWNNTKKTELETLEGLCSEASASCGSIFSPISYLPDGDFNLIEEVFKGTPIEGQASNMLDLLDLMNKKLPGNFFNPPTYKKGKSGTQSYFESSTGVLPFINLKAQFTQDPMDPSKGLDQKLCLEVLGNDSCIGVRYNKETGRDEYYQEGVLKDNIDMLNKAQKDMDQMAQDIINKSKKNN